MSRTPTITTDQLLLDSAYYVDAEAKRLGYRVHWTAAANTNCGAGASDEMFCPELGSCLWTVGFERALPAVTIVKRLRGGGYQMKLPVARVRAGGT